MHKTKSYQSTVVRPNPEGRIIRKQEGRIFYHKAEMIKNGKGEFHHKVEYLRILITPQYKFGLTVRPTGY